MSDVWQSAPLTVERWVSTRNPAVVWTVVVTDGSGPGIDPADIEAAVAAYLDENPPAASPLSDDPAAPLGVAAPGTSTEVSRGDHVHPLPTPADIGAAAVGDIPDVSGFVADSDPRLSDARTPTAHSHPAADVTGLAAVATSGAYSDLTGTPTIPDRKNIPRTTVSGATTLNHAALGGVLVATSAATITIPATVDEDAAFPTNAHFWVHNAGSAAVQIAGATGVTFTDLDVLPGGTVHIWRIAADTWVPIRLPVPVIAHDAPEPAGYPLYARLPEP